MKTLILNPIFLAAPVLIALLLIELVYSNIKGQAGLYKLKDFLVSTVMGIGTLFISTFIKFVSPLVIFYVIYNNFNSELNGINLNFLGYESFGWGWPIWLACIILNDFSNYWYHRFNHTIRIFWAAHIVHHSSAHYNYGTALRLSWVAMFYKPLYYMWLSMIGFHPEMIVVCLGVESVWQFALHTTYCPNIPVLKLFLITPKQHQVHHAKNIEYLDKNHGAIFSIWDRLFGTWKDFDKEIDIQYGVIHPPNSYNLITILTHEFKAIWKDVKKAETLNEKFYYVFGPPGWSPNNTSLTVKQLQSQVT